MIYFDNAATSFPKPKCVIDDVNRCIKKYCGNPGRSSHILSEKAAEEIYSVREAIAKHFGFKKSENVVFTYNATYALNLAIKSFLTKDCHVITSDFEHNSVLRPIESAKKKYGIQHSIFHYSGDINKDISPLIQSNTKMIISSVASNVTGDFVDIGALSQFAKEHGLILIVDASQAVGHEEINLNSTPCDVICAPGHKALFGIQGCGFALFKENTRREGLVEGGSGTESINPMMPEFLPEGYEAGTLSTPSIVSLGSGIKYIESIGLNNIKEKLCKLSTALREELSSIPKIKIYPIGVSILSFNLSNVPSSLISAELNSYGICTRGGLHCAPSVHKKIGTLNQGAVRISLSYLNTIDEIGKFYKAMKTIAKKY